VILALKTNEPTAYLALVDGVEVVEEYRWGADRQLADTLLPEIEKLLQRHKLGWEEVSGLVVYRGPGSFTGLRIGLTVANAIAYARQILIAGGTGEDWLQSGLKALGQTEMGEQVMPEYGAEPNISKPKK
jgi:tRNA threonylcarbamoyladenosine biosynthesis protein TsaB